MYFHPTDYFTSIEFSYSVLIPLFGWFLPLTNVFFTTIFLVIRNFPLRKFPQFQHICNVFFGVFLPLSIYISLPHFPPPIPYSPQDIFLLSVHIPLPISLPRHYLTVQRIILSSACCDISLYIIFIFWLRLLVSYFWWRLMMYLPKKKGSRFWWSCLRQS